MFCSRVSKRWQARLYLSYNQSDTLKCEKKCIRIIKISLNRIFHMAKLQHS